MDERTNRTAQQRIEVTSPVDGRVVGSLDAHSAADVASIASRLRASQPEWEALGTKGRVECVRKYRDWLFDHNDEISDLLRQETGKSEHDARLELPFSIDNLNYYANNAAKFLAPEKPSPASALTRTRRLETVYKPYQLVGVISPWNFPIALSMFDAIPALLAGAAVVVKPSTVTPLAVHRMIEGWAEIGAPDVLACAVGSGGVGTAVVDNVDYVQFTGSTETGISVGKRAAERLIPCGLELGGKDPAIVLADADIDLTAQGIAFWGLVNSGQMCTSVERIYVEEAIYPEFVEALTKVVGGLRQGGEAGFDTDIGAMATESQVTIVQEHLDDAVAKGATVTVGGTISGHFIAPAVLSNVDHSMRVMNEETFGPVLPVMRVADADEAVRLANDSPFGLSASVWTGDADRGRRIGGRIEAGSVVINDGSAHLICFPVPQSGWKTSGIGGRFGGAEGIRKYTRTQAFVSHRVELAALSKLLWYPYSATKSRTIMRTMRFLGAGDLRRKLGK
ncbi:aldehyde dehydrogenase family protein [Hoyosella sp. G463]|uniref:Aldehyde dehydrogenase n=1 Tax=Lolliginicoccus lacisalsi TaxID=2742202 RepID=A0A927J9E0_9ACTN|nr:aldehyde dehydrogenase family protein [Lolliginicoccus lacisalsi]MBD8505103.1 aldehyde dehydrogenase family protein [Lolliginicoccus lacisalsi]